MRALRVLGLTQTPENGDGKFLVCEDPSTGEQFSVPCDDRLRAGARGDLSRFGQLEIEMESQLRPREIQARIRSGATVEQVASLAGTTTARVERFAYPVLLERASIVERAIKARPSIDGITAGSSVAETVAATLAARGHDGDVSWDAFKDDDGWVLCLRWNAGRSDNQAQWLFHPGPDGGTLSARDEAAAEIVDPALRILRPLRPVRQSVVSSALLDPTVPTDAPPSDGRAFDSRSAEKNTSERPADARATRGGPSSAPSEAASRSAHPAGGKLSAPGTRPQGGSDRPGQRGSRFGQQLQPQNRAGATGGAATAMAIDPDQDIDAVERIVEDTITDERAGVNPIIADATVARTGTESAAPAGPSKPAAATPSKSSTASPAATTAAKPEAPKPARRGQRPSMPSWEDVLLGTRSNGR
ncbi:hypothetical protein ABIB25_001272 [Nakamurella sp. UYEF19]|uniref:septation protein SepH n=1 Tax=Nakamurella sp. UYEF19 TaxID=1756392 RepID=UPI00339B020F